MTALTPFSTVGPFFKLLVRHRQGDVDTLVTEATRGRRITIEGVLLDGLGAPIDDGLIEIWQADAEGRYNHPEDPRAQSADPAFGGFGRVATGPTGAFAFHTIRPGAVPGPDEERPSGVPGDPGGTPLRRSGRQGGTPLTRSGRPVRLQAPHILVSVMARGIMSRCWTRIYFDDDAANAHDPVLTRVPEERRGTLIARSTGDGSYRFDIVLQGQGETVFFDA